MNDVIKLKPGIYSFVLPDRSMKLIDMSSYEISVFRTLVSDNTIHTLTIQYYLEDYIEYMGMTEVYPELVELSSRKYHFLRYVMEYMK